MGSGYELELELIIFINERIQHDGLLNGFHDMNVFQMKNEFFFFAENENKCFVHEKCQL